MDDIRILDKCTQCGACVAVCTGHVFIKADKVAVAAPEACFRCGHCVAVCPVDAVSHNGFGGQPFPPIDPSLRVSPDAMRTALRARRSVRQFRDRPIPRETLEQLLDVARYAPTASNAQGVEWIVVTDPARRLAMSRRVIHWMSAARGVAFSSRLTRLATRIAGRKQAAKTAGYLNSLQRMLEISKAGGDPIFHCAPAVLVSHAGAGSGLGVENATYATTHVMLLAESLGLASCLIGFFTSAARFDPKLHELVQLPPGHRVTTTVVLGYPIYHYRRLTARQAPKVHWIEAAP